MEAGLPLFLFSILFGLSMGYQIFLLSRIRERFDQTHDNVGSVAFGVRTTGRLIAGATFIMVVVFGRVREREPGAVAADGVRARGRDLA